MKNAKPMGSAGGAILCLRALAANTTPDKAHPLNTAALLIQQQALTIDSLQRRVAELEAYEAALTPSMATKIAYAGEFSFSIPAIDEDGDEFQQKVMVPWTVIKKIMAIIRSHASVQEQPK